MRIMLCPSAYAPHIGGVEELTNRLAIEYQNQGHEVLVVTARWPLNLPAHEIIRDTEVYRIDYIMPKRKIKDLLLFCVLFPLRLWALAQIIRRFRPDVVHIQCVSVQGFYFLTLKKLLGFKLIVTMQGEQRADDYLIYQRTRIMRPMLNRLLKNASYVTACSYAALCDGFGDKSKLTSNCSVISNGISLNELDNLQSANIEFATARPYIFALGRQVKVKGFDILVEAFSQIAQEYPNIDLIIGGNGQEHLALQKRVCELNLEKRIYLPGYLNREETVAHLRKALFLVVPSRYESFGIAGLEAMASRKAVIGMAVGGVPEVIVTEETGLLVPAEDVNALAEAISQLLSTPELADAMGSRGRARVENLFTWPHIAEQYLQLYQQI